VPVNCTYTKERRGKSGKGRNTEKWRKILKKIETRETWREMEKCTVDGKVWEVIGRGERRWQKVVWDVNRSFPSKFLQSSRRHRY